jgi:hypothetical protein
MNVKKCIAACAAIAAIATASVLAGDTVHVFRTTSLFEIVKQGTDPLQFTEHLWDGSNLVALALGADPTSNQVFAMDIDCDSTVAHLEVFDKSTSNKTVIATSASFDLVERQALTRLVAGPTNEERFVAQFNVNPTNDLLGGFLTVAGRLHLGTNGCPTAVLISLDRNSDDSLFDDRDVPDTDQDARLRDELRAGQGHFVGVLDYVKPAGTTNTVLIPLGHMTFRHELE